MMRLVTQAISRPRVGAKPPPVGAVGGWSCKVHDVRKKKGRGAIS
jgi:hypothetical protein